MQQERVPLEQLETMRGADVYSQDGEKIGTVEEVYYDEQTRLPEWIGLGTGFFGTKRVLVPMEAASLSENQVAVPYAKDYVQDAPDIDGDEISQETESALYAYYELEYSEPRPDTGFPESARAGAEDEAVDTGLAAGAMPPDSPGDRLEGTASVTRSEEELRVGKREQELGRLRLHKWVESEQVDVPVELRREKARVTREPVDATVGEREIGEESLEVTLSEERPVVEKETVAKERIGIEKDVDVEQETVSREVRKERVDLEDETSP